MQFVFLFWLIVLISGIDGANILACLSSSSRSHHIIETTVLEDLASKGHNITVLSTFPAPKTKLENYHHIFTPVEDADEWLSLRKGMLNNDSKNEENQLQRMLKILKMIVHRSSEILKHKEVQNLMQSDQQFDLFILGYNLNDMLLGIAGHFRCPSVILSTMPAMKPLRDFIGNPAEVSSAPLFSHSRKANDPLSFFERLRLFFEYAIEYTIVSYVNHFVYDKFYNEFFPPSKNYPTFDEVKKNVSLILTNTHFSEGTIRPALPNLIEIGGVHIREEPSALPENLQNIFNAANSNGVILFSFGGNIRSADMSEDKTRILYNVFSQLDEQIIWKWESESIPTGKPENVHMFQWLPQTDLLAQKQIRLFISHCGLGGVYEAKFYGVPILGIPIYGDQMANAKQIESQGWSIMLNFDTLNETVLLTSIKKMLNNSTYKLTAQKLSQLFRDRPMTPLNTAIYWIEYVIRHEGAKHMQSSAVYLNIFQKCSVDVICFICLVSFVLVRLMIKVFNIILRRWSLIILTISFVSYFIIYFVDKTGKTLDS